MKTTRRTFLGGAGAIAASMFLGRRAMADDTGGVVSETAYPKVDAEPDSTLEVTYELAHRGYEAAGIGCVLCEAGHIVGCISPHGDRYEMREGKKILTWEDVVLFHVPSAKEVPFVTSTEVYTDGSAFATVYLERPDQLDNTPGRTGIPSMVVAGPTSPVLCNMEFRDMELRSTRSGNPLKPFGVT